MRRRSMQARAVSNGKKQSEQGGGMTTTTTTTTTSMAVAMRRNRAARRKREVTTTAATVMISRGANGVKEKETRSARGDAKLRDAVRLGAQGDVLEDEPVHWATLGIAGSLDVALLVQAAQP